jgi:hypothetical protein
MKKMGIHIRKVTPVWAPANGEVETIMQSLTKMIQTAGVEGQNWKDGLNRFLLSYRATPHTVTGFSPAKLLFNRELKTLLPEIPRENADHLGDHHRQARVNDGEAKQKIAVYANNSRYRKPSTVQVGDTVLLRNEKKLKNKMAPAFFPEPLTIAEKNQGSMITASSAKKSVTRNSSFFKPFDCGDPVLMESDGARVPAPMALPLPNPPPPDAADEPSHENAAEPPARQAGDDFQGLPDAEPFVADNFPPLSSDEEDDVPQRPPAPERRGLRPRRRPDPLHYVGKGVQGKKQDGKNSQV